MKDGKPPGTSLPRLEAAKKGVEVSQRWGDAGVEGQGMSGRMQPQPD